LYEHANSLVQIPRIELEEAGPAMDLSLRRMREAPADLLKEAMKQPLISGRKEKNVGFEDVEGKVGRIYMPKQDIADVALAKGKGVKRARRDAAAARKVAKTAPAALAGAGRGTSATLMTGDAVNIGDSFKEKGC
jgi:ribosome production factor 2